MINTRDGLHAPIDLLERTGLGAEALKAILMLALESGGDFAEIYLEYREHHSVRMEEDILKDTSESLSLGLGIRVCAGERTGYAYTNDLSMEKIRNAARAAAAVASAPARVQAIDLRIRPTAADVYRVLEPAGGAPLEKKIRLVREAYDAAKALSSLIRKVNVSFQDLYQEVTIADSEGLLVSDARPMVKLSAVAVAEGAGGRREYGFAGGGGRVGMEAFPPDVEAAAIGREAAQEAVDLLSSVDAPAGEMPVVLAPGHAGVLIHEAVGHLLEADFNRKKTSVFWDKLGRKVGAEGVTIYDDPTIPAFRGSYAVDDEGTAPRKTLLVEKGVVRGFLQDKLSARLMGMARTGHGRRQDYTDFPIPRMANTYIERGGEDPAAILRSVKKGLYAERFTGGQVEDSGKFTFTVSSGRLIEEGRLTARVKQATLIGSNLDILHKIKMVGNDLAFSPQTGTCSKEGQDVPVTDGCPTILISRLTVGGG